MRVCCSPFPTFAWVLLEGQDEDGENRAGH